MQIITTNINLAISDLNEGKPVAIPTETVYGLAASIYSEKAIKAVYAMKNRPLNHPLIVHVTKSYDLSEFVDEIPEYARQLMHHFWPGPLTLVLNSKPDAINPLITSGQPTVAIRAPAHPLTEKLLKKLHTPLVAPSANPFGKISPTTALHVKQSFPDEKLTILDGGRCSVGIESTIIDATKEDSYKILRHGLIDEETIQKVVSTHHVTESSNIRVPGALETHYQPQKSLFYFKDDTSLSLFCSKRPGDVAVIAHKKPASVDAIYFGQLPETPEKAAYELYYQLRKADESNALCIAIKLPPNKDQWAGVHERIIKAGMPYSI